MGNKKNEQGYALLIVLFLVVFIMIVMAVFMRGSISNAKQERKVDQNHLSVVAAEMGVDYYSNLFKNKFFEVREGIWSENNKQFKIEKAQIESDKQEKNKTAKIIELSNKYRNKIAIEIGDKLDSIKGEKPENEGIFINAFEGLNVISVKNENIIINGKIKGYNKLPINAILDMELYFLIPSLLPESSSENPNTELDSSYNINTVPNVTEIKLIDISGNVGDEYTSNLYKLVNVLIQKNGNIEKGQIQEITGKLEISATGNFKSNQVYKNENVLIRTNGNFETGQLQDNIGPLTISVKSNFKSSNLNGNTDVSIQTNGNFNTLQLQDNKARLIITSSGNFKSSNIQQNTNVTIITNGNLESGQIQDNKEYLTISASGNFKSLNIYGNAYTSILTNGNFETGQIQKNEGQLSISSSGNFLSTNVYENVSTKILTQGNFETGQIQNNKESIKISALGNFKSTNVYGNAEVSIIADGNFTSGQIRDNSGRVTIIAKKNFTADEIQLRNSSLVCVGGNFTVKNNSSIDSSSYLYLIKGHGVIANIPDQNQIKYLTSDEWKNKCKTSGSESDSVVSWKDPIVNVEY